MLKKRFLSLIVVVLLAVTIFLGAALFFSSNQLHLADDPSYVSTLDNVNDFTGSLGKDTGEELEIDLTDTATATSFNGSTRTYYLYALEVVSDLFTVSEGQFLWEVLPSADVVSLYSQFTNTTKFKFKFYSRIGGRTDAVLRYYIPGRAQTAEWGTINFVFIVRNNEYAYNATRSPQNNPDIQTRTYDGYANSVTFNAQSIAVDPQGFSDEFKIMAASIAYPGAVDASPYTMYDIGLDIDLKTYTGCYTASGFSSMTIRMKTQYYLGFGVELLIKNASTGYLGLVNCYVLESNSIISQNVPKRVEERTSVMAGIAKNAFNLLDGYDNPPITNPTRVRTLTANQRTNAYHKVIDQLSEQGTYQYYNYQTQSVIHEFDVVVQQNQQYEEYTSVNAFYYCPTHGKSATGSHNAQHTAAKAGDDQFMCSHRFYSMPSDPEYAKGSKTSVTHDNGSGTKICSRLTLVTRTWSTSGQPYFMCEHGFISATDSPISHADNTGGAKITCTRNTTALNSTVSTSACAYTAYSPVVMSTRYTNWNSVPFYFQANTQQSSIPVSMMSEISISNINVRELSLSAKAGATQLSLAQLKTDDGQGNYSEIDRIYAYDRAYMSVGLIKKRNNSTISIAGLKNTKASNPKYLVIAVSNYTPSQKFTTLVSVKVNITGIPNGTNPNAIIRTNAEPEKNPDAPESYFKFEGSRGDQKNFFADNTRPESIAIDPDTTDDFAFPSSGGIVFSDPLGVTLDSNFTVTVSNQNHTLTLVAEEVFTGTIYLKVVDVNFGEGFIPIECIITNRAPKFEDGKLTEITISSSVLESSLTSDLHVAAYRKITTLAQPTSGSDSHTVYSIASDADHQAKGGKPQNANGFMDVLTIEAFEVPTATLNFLTITYQDPHVVNGTTIGYKTIQFVAKKWTNSLKITIRVFDGYTYTKTECKFVIRNTPVELWRNDPSKYIFSGKSGDVRTYTGADLGNDFDGDNIAIVQDSLRLIANSGMNYSLATNGTNSFASATIANDTLTITLIAKSIPIYDQMDDKGHFFISVYIKDAGDTSAGNGKEVRIGVKVDSTAPITADKDFSFTSGNERSYDASSFAFDPDVKEMQFTVDYTSSQPRMADRLYFYSLTLPSDISHFADIYFVDDKGSVLDSSADYKQRASLKISPKRWTNGKKTFSVRIYDSSQSAQNSLGIPSDTIITFQVTNTKPIYRDTLSQTSLGSKDRPYTLNLSLEDRVDAPREYYLYPYTFVTDADLPVEFEPLSNDSSKDSTIYYRTDTPGLLPEEYDDFLGRPILEYAEMDILKFDLVPPTIRNNALKYIEEESLTNPTNQNFYKISARTRSINNPSVELIFTIIDSYGEKIQVYINVNVLNSTPIVNPTLETQYELQVSGETRPTTYEWTISQLVYELDVLDTIQLDKPTFMSDTYVVLDNTLVGDALNAPANNASKHVNLSIKMGTVNLGETVLSATAVSRTINEVFIGCRIVDNAPGDNNSRVTSIIWLGITVLNSAPVENTPELTYAYNSPTTEFSHSIMIRAMDKVVMRESGLLPYEDNGEGLTDEELKARTDGIIEEGNFKYSRNYSSGIMPLIIIATDPDNDTLSMQNTPSFSTESSAFTVDLKLTSTTGEWFYILNIASVTGTGSISFLISDGAASLDITFNIAVSAAAITEKYKGADFPWRLQYRDDANMTTLEPLDLLQMVYAGGDEHGYSENADFVRLQKNVEITDLGGLTEGNVYTTLPGGMSQAKYVSATLKTSDTKYIDILGGQYYVFPDNTSIPPANRGMPAPHQLDDEGQRNHCRVIYLRGKQRTITPINVTFAIHISKNTQTGVKDKDGNDTKLMDLNGDGIFEPNVDIYRFTVAITVRNATVSIVPPTNPFQISLNASTTDATISTAGINTEGKNHQIALKPSDKDGLDDFFISIKSIDVGSFVDRPSGTLNGSDITEYFDNRNYSVEGKEYDYKTYFNIKTPDDVQNGGTKYLYIEPLRRTTDIPGGYFPLYMMVYDNYLDSSLDFTPEQIIEGSISGTGKSGAFADYVSRTIVCVRIYINNSMPTAISSKVSVVQSYKKDKSTVSGSFLLSDLFHDPDMAYVNVGDKKYFDMQPDEGYDTIQNVTVSKFSGSGSTSAENYISVVLSEHYKVTSDYFDYSENANWYKGDCQRLTYLIKSPVHNNNRGFSFTVTLWDSVGAYAEVEIHIEVQNTPPVPNPLPSGNFEFDMYVGQTVTFDLTKDTNLNQNLDEIKLPSVLDIGTILPAIDEERQETVYVYPLKNGASNFVALNANYLKITYTTSTLYKFSITAQNATEEGIPYEFRFMVSDDDTSNTLTDMTYLITIRSRPPMLIDESGELIGEQGGVSKASKIIPLKLNTPKSLNLSDYIRDVDMGDTMSIVQRPSYVSGYNNFRNYPDSIYSPSCFVKEGFSGYENFLIAEGNGDTSRADYFNSAQNAKQNQWLKIETTQGMTGIEVTAQNVYSDKVTLDTAVISVVFYVADRSNMAVEIIFNFVVTNDTISPKNSEKQSRELSGAGESTRLSLSDYLKGSNDGADIDFENINTRYNVEITEQETNIKFATYTIENGYTYVPEGGSFRDYFDLTESGGIELGKYLNFISKRRTNAGERFGLTIKVTKPLWIVNMNAPVLSQSVAIIEWDVYVQNSAPTVIQENKPKIRAIESNKSDFELFKGQPKELILYGSGSGKFLMQDSDLDKISFDPLEDITITGDGGDEILNQFRECLDIQFDEETGIIRFTMLSKMHNVDQNSEGKAREYVTRTINIQTRDEVGENGDLLSFPITLSNSAPTVKPGMSKITFSVINNEFYTTVKEGAEYPYIELIDFIDDADFDSPIETYMFKFSNMPDFTGGSMTIYDKKETPIADLIISTDNRRIEIKGRSYLRGNVSEDVRVTIIDGSGEYCMVTFSFVVGNKAPYALSDEPIVLNVLGSDDEENVRAVFVNKDEHDNYVAEQLKEKPYSVLPSFVGMFRDDNPSDKFIVNDVIGDILIHNQDEPSIQIESFEENPKAAFLIRTKIGIYGQERITLKVFDANTQIATTDLNTDALSTTVEIIINIAKNPSTLEKKTFVMYNGHERDITPAEIFGEDNCLGYAFRKESFKFLNNGNPSEQVLQPNVEVLEDGAIKAKAEGVASIMAVLFIDEHEFLITIDVQIDPNTKPEQLTTEIRVVKAQTTNVDEKYGTRRYAYFEISEFFYDVEGDDIVIMEMSSNKDVIVETRIARDGKSFDLLCYARGTAKITIIVKDAIAKHTYVFDYTNDDLDKLSMWAYLYADYNAYQSTYIIGLIIAIAVLLVTLFVIFSIIRRVRMKRALERLLQHELENEQELIMISQGFDPNQGYLAQAGELFGIDTMNVQKREQLASKKMQMLDSQKKAFDILQLNSGMDETMEMLEQLDNEELQHDNMEDYLNQKLNEFLSDESSVQEPEIKTAAPIKPHDKAAFDELKTELRHDIIDENAVTPASEDELKEMKESIYEAIDKTQIPLSSENSDDIDLEAQLNALLGENEDPNA